jgi:hypothetical protein
LSIVILLILQRFSAFFYKRNNVFGKNVAKAAAAFYKLKGIGVYQHSRTGDSHALADRLFAHIHHLGTALFVKMSKIRHVSASYLVHVPAGTAALSGRHFTVPLGLAPDGGLKLLCHLRPIKALDGILKA